MPLDSPLAACAVAMPHRGSAFEAPHPTAGVSRGKSAVVAAARPRSTRGHQDHHRGPAPGDVPHPEAERLLVADSLSNKSELLLFINAGIASKSLSMFGSKVNASETLINIVKRKRKESK